MNMVAGGRRKSIAFFISLGIGLILVVLLLYIGWVLLGWRNPVLLFFGMLSRTNYVLDESRFSAALAASFTVVAKRMRDFQAAELAR